MAVTGAAGRDRPGRGVAWLPAAPDPGARGVAGVAAAAAQAFDYVGLPEGVYPMVQATLYLATAAKSNSA